MTLATRCPSCGTVFRVVQDQLRVSEGWVRCGRCSEPFNALEAMVDWPPVRTPAAPAPAEGAPAPEPSPQGGDAANASPERSGVTIDDGPESLARESEPTPEPTSEPAPAAAIETANETTNETPTIDGQVQHRAVESTLAGAPAEPTLIDLPPGVEVVATDGAIGPEVALPPEVARGHDEGFDPILGTVPATEAKEPAPAATVPAPVVPAPALADSLPADEIAAPAAAMAEPAPSFVLQADRAARWRRPGVRIALGLASLLATLGLAAQVTHAYRDRIAAASPALRPWLQQACATLGCRVGEYRQIDALSVESSGLVRVEGAPVYRLAVTLRNRAPLEVAAPAVDLALTDAQGQQLARRILTMADLNLPLRSLKPGSELPIQAPLRIDGEVSGYTVEIFYP